MIKLQSFVNAVEKRITKRGQNLGKVIFAHRHAQDAFPR